MSAYLEVQKLVLVNQATINQSARAFGLGGA